MEIDRRTDSGVLQKRGAPRVELEQDFLIRSRMGRTGLRSALDSPSVILEPPLGFILPCDSTKNALKVPNPFPFCA